MKLVTTSSERYQILVDSLRLVAASAQDQLQTLPDFAVVTDEIMLTVDNAIHLIPELQREGAIGLPAVDALRQLGAWADSLPTDRSLADASTLRSHDYWAQGRVLATQALQVLSQAPGLPPVPRSGAHSPPL